MGRVQATYRRRRYLPEGMWLPWGRYERHAHLFWRIRIPLFVGLAALGWLVWRSPGAVIGLVAAALVEAGFSYRRQGAGRPAPTPVASGPARREAIDNYLRALAPSPAGWESPRGVIPMWNWTPTGGGQPRLDRVPRWVRAWYHTPFVDRYAHAWMWRHGGWDILPPSYHSE
jgi:hypothetical protein